MSGLMGELLSSAQSLGHQSTALSVIGNNIANVNNSSYARQTVETSTSSGPGGVVTTSSGVVSSRDSILDRQVIEETSTSGALNAQVSLYDDLNTVMSESLNGSLGTTLATAQSEGTGITGGLTSFFNAWSAYAASPNSSAAQSEVLSSADELASRLNEASASLDEVQSDQDAALEADVKTANTLLDKIATLNSQIVSMEAREKGSSSGLADEREAAMEDLAKLINFNYTTEDNGSVSITVDSTDATGAATTTTLVSNGNAGSIGIVSDTSDADGDGNTEEYTGLSATSSDGVTTSTISPTGGTLSVLKPEATSEAIENLRTRLDALAKQLVTSVNELYAQSSADGTAAFLSGTAADIAVSSTITDASDIVAASASGTSGNNETAMAISKLADESFSTKTTTDASGNPVAGDAIDGTFTGYAASVATEVADKLETASDASDAQRNVLSLVTTNRDATSGVTTDEEMSNLIRTQHAYQASARVMSTINTLLELVATRLGA